MSNQYANMNSPWIVSISGDGKEVFIEALTGEFYDKGECDAPSTILMVVEGGGSMELDTTLADAICTEHNKMFSGQSEEVADLSMRYL